MRSFSMQHFRLFQSSVDKVFATSAQPAIPLDIVDSQFRTPTTRHRVALLRRTSRQPEAGNTLSTDYRVVYPRIQSGFFSYFTNLMGGKSEKVSGELPEH